MPRSIQYALIMLCLAAAPALADDAVVGNIGTQAVKASDVHDFLDTLNPQQREQASKDPKAMVQLVRSAIGRKLLLDDAAKQSWDKKPEIAVQIARAREEIVLNTYLRSVTLPPATYPGDDEIKTTYDANKDRFRQYHIAQIFVVEPPGSTKDAVAAIQKKAADLAKKAKAKGTDFAGLAKSNSDDAASAAKGGDLGWLSENQILPEILGAVAALPDKGVSEPIHAAGGWHILNLIGAKPADLAQVRDQIVNVLRETKMAQNQQSYVAKMLDERKVTVDETAAASLFAPGK